jgi:hypothetical protein
MIVQDSVAMHSISTRTSPPLKMRSRQLPDQDWPIFDGAAFCVAADYQK